MLRHDVVAVLVHIAHHLGQRGRGADKRGLEPRGHLAFTHAAGELAPQLAPHAFHRAGGKLPRRGVGHGPDSLAAGSGVSPLEDDFERVVQFRAQGPAPVAAVCPRRGQSHRGRALHPSQWRVVLDVGKPGRRVGHKGHHAGLVVEQQRIGRCVVGAQGLAIETARVLLGDIKGRAVEHDVAHDDLDALRLQAPHQQPQALHHQLGVALALDVDIALEAATLHHALHKHRRAPGVSRAELFQRCIGGDEFHHRGRVDGHLRPVRQPGRRACTALRIGHQHAQGFARQLGAGQGGFHLRRQGRRTGRLRTGGHHPAQPHSQPHRPHPGTHPRGGDDRQTAVPQKSPRREGGKKPRDRKIPHTSESRESLPTLHEKSRRLAPATPCHPPHHRNHR